MKALIFDFDGLIIDTETPDFVSWQEIYASMGVSLDVEKWGLIIGSISGAHFDPCTNLQELVGKAVDCASIRGERRAQDWALLLAQPVLPGVMAYLEEAKRIGLRIAIASSSPHSWVDTHLERVGLLHYFDAVICADDVENVKPAPDLFLTALQRLGVNPEEAIIFEDSPNGILAANRAGVYVVAVPNLITRQLDTSKADLVLISLEDMGLGELLQRVNSNVSKWNV